LILGEKDVISDMMKKNRTIEWEVKHK
jgi:hypothetical protein